MHIPEEAIEAAARAVYEDNYKAITAGSRWGTSEYRDIQVIYLREARIALEAALPHLGAPVNAPDEG